MFWALGTVLHDGNASVWVQDPKEYAFSGVDSEPHVSKASPVRTGWPSATATKGLVEEAPLSGL